MAAHDNHHPAPSWDNQTVAGTLTLLVLFLLFSAMLIWLFRPQTRRSAPHGSHVPHQTNFLSCKAAPHRPLPPLAGLVELPTWNFLANESWKQPASVFQRGPFPRWSVIQDRTTTTSIFQSIPLVFEIPMLEVAA